MFKIQREKKKERKRTLVKKKVLCHVSGLSFKPPLVKR